MKLLLYVATSFYLISCAPKNKEFLIKASKQEIEIEKNADDGNFIESKTETIKIDEFQTYNNEAQTGHFVQTTPKNVTYNYITNLVNTYSSYFKTILILDISTRAYSPTAQSMHVFYANNLLYKLAISSARPGKITPQGFFTPQKIYKNYDSHAFGAAMPHAVFFHQDAFAIHGVLGNYYLKDLGHRASAGCVRVHPDEMAKVWQLILDEASNHDPENRQLVDSSFKGTVRKGPNSGVKMTFERHRYRFTSKQCNGCSSYTPFVQSYNITRNGNLLYADENNRLIEKMPNGGYKVLQTNLSDESALMKNRGFNTLIIVKNFSNEQNYFQVQLDQNVEPEVSEYYIRN